MEMDVTSDGGFDWVTEGHYTHMVAACNFQGSPALKHTLLYLKFLD